MTARQSPVRMAVAGSVRTAYRQSGSGPLLLLMHGAEADHEMFLALMEELDADFTVVAYDQRDSGTTENDDEPYDLGSLADDAAALIRLIAGPASGAGVHLYGTSFGGQIAQVLAARHPQLVHRLV
ncbi:MAG: alpha/beta fold hydrolase, partial [Comamonadaceae bacterium]